MEKVQACINCTEKIYIFNFFLSGVTSLLSTMAFLTPIDICDTWFTSNLISLLTTVIIICDDIQ